MNARIRTIISWTAWPLLLVLSITATAVGFAHDGTVLAFNVIYLALAAVLLLLERRMPHEVEWSKPDHQLMTDLLHTVMSKGTVQTLIIFSSVIGIADFITPSSHPGYGIWPRHWPMAAQVVTGIVVAEFGFYWAHRLAHEWPPLWPFHAVHHSVTKLWVLNTGRFHFVDSLKSILPGVLILALLGAPLEVLTWLSAITAYIGILTHCNVELKFGVLSKIFNTPELHRWHHSMDLSEGNKNYGENITLWDWVFGTWFSAARRPPVTIGIAEPMPKRFREQLSWPFRRAFKV